MKTVQIVALSIAGVLALVLIRYIIKDVIQFFKMKNAVKESKEDYEHDLETRVEASTEQIAEMSDAELAARFNENEKGKEGPK